MRLEKVIIYEPLVQFEAREMRGRRCMSVIEIEERIDGLVAGGFNPEDFIFDFIEAFGAPKSVIKQLKGGQQDAFGQAPVLWKRQVHFQMASEGQVGTVLSALAGHKDTEKQKVRYIISTDGHDFGARDLKSGESLNCLFGELGVHFGFFLPLAGIERYKIADENPVDIKATGRLAKFYDAILQDNPTWRGDEKRHALNHFITQVVFCLFAEDTGILPPNLFAETITTYCETDSAQAQKVLTDVFTAMALPEGERGDDCPSYARKFPHVNGGLFKGAPEVPRFTKGSVRYLIDAGQLNWKEINPDIFGSMIQSIVNADQRGELGMHYTSVPNILKVLDPLFLDDLHEQMNANWNNKKGLHGILRRLSKIRVFDPACGSGNFLVIAYRELRAIEIKVVNRLYETDAGYSAPIWSHVELTNFYGIEYADFAAETAKLSLWIAEYQMNSRYEDAFGKRTPALPLKETGNIVCGNALRVAWESVCPHSDDPEVETYIVGNPPYLGRQMQTKEQKDDKEELLSGTIENYKSLDYVAGWFVLGAKIAAKRDLLNKQWHDILVAYPTIFDASRAHEDIAASMVDMEEPWSGLRCRGFQNPHAKGLMDYVHAAYVERIRSNLSIESWLMLLFRWLNPEHGAKKITGAIEVIEAVLDPWLTQPPSYQIRQLIVEYLVNQYNDPRTHNTLWTGVSSNYMELILKWLAANDLRLFIFSVNAMYNSPHWQKRRRFWLQLYDEGYVEEAWVAVCPAAERYIKKFIGEFGLDYFGERVVRFGKQKNGGVNTSLLIMRVGSKIVVEGCHNYRTHIFNFDDPLAPELYREEYNAFSDVIDVSPLSKPHEPFSAWSHWILESINSETPMSSPRGKPGV